MKNIVTQYFDRWNCQDLDGLRSLFTSDVTLKDWEIEVTGVEEVVQANANIFSNFPKIKAEIIQLGFEDNLVFAELIIHLNEQEKISVVDVLSIESDKIRRIQAYKC